MGKQTAGRDALEEFPPPKFAEWNDGVLSGEVWPVAPL